MIEARASTIADGTVQGDRARASAKAVVEAVERITGVVRALLDFSRRKGEGAAPVAVRSLVEGTLEFFAPWPRAAASRSRPTSVMRRGASWATRCSSDRR